MNRKRMLTILALVVIMAVLIVPSLVPHYEYTDSQSPEVKTVPNANTEQLQSTGNDEKQAPGKQTGITGEAGDNKQPETSSRPGQMVEPAVRSVADSTEFKGCQVGIAVVGIGGKLLYSPTNVTVVPDNKWGITALGTLDATGLSYATKPMWPDFVDSICGQACQGVAGWMYMVNGEIPMHLADKHPVREGDQVIWWYSESMDQAPPVWDELAGTQH